MATIKEIARECQVSIATVSNIINEKGSVSEKTKKRVLEAIEEMNYTPNSVAINLKKKSTRSIGIIAEDMTVFSLPEIIDGITECCEKDNYQILLTNLRLYKKFTDAYYKKNMHIDLVHAEIRKLMAKQVEGIIYISAHERLINYLPKNLSVPIVVAYGYTNNTAIPSVIVDDVRGSYEIVRYLITCGHKKIGVIAGKKESIHTQDRLEGYQSALYDSDILYNPALITYGDWERDCGYKNTDYLVNKGATAIVCMNDIMAGGVYDRLNELKVKVGDEISVVGYDDREIASFFNPPLTTVALPLHDIGFKASKILISLLEEQKGEPEIKDHAYYYIPCLSQIRKSVKAIGDQ